MEPNEYPADLQAELDEIQTRYRVEIADLKSLWRKRMEDSRNLPPEDQRDIELRFEQKLEWLLRDRRIDLACAVQDYEAKHLLS